MQIYWVNYNKHLSYIAWKYCIIHYVSTFIWLRIKMACSLKIFGTKLEELMKRHLRHDVHPINHWCKLRKAFLLYCICTFLTHLSPYLPLLSASTSSSRLHIDWNLCILSFPPTRSVKVKSLIPLSVKIQHAMLSIWVHSRRKKKKIQNTERSSCLRNIWHFLSLRITAAYLEACTSPRATVFHLLAIRVKLELKQTLAWEGRNYSGF